MKMSAQTARSERDERREPLAWSTSMQNAISSSQWVGKYGSSSVLVAIRNVIVRAAFCALDVQYPRTSSHMLTTS